MIHTGTGNLLEADVDALVNTVNCAGVMGKGIALQFKRAWPDMYKVYRAHAEAGRIVPGRIHVWPTGLLQRPRFILNFPTKRHWKERSRLEDIELGLSDLVQQVGALGIRSLAMPPLGAGNGGLDWAEVRPRILQAFALLPDVEVLLWEPGGAPPVEERPVNTHRPHLTPVRAAVLALMGRYAVLDYRLSQLEVQKLAYFLQVAGENLRLNYHAAAYGPYADGLYHLLMHLEGHQVVGLEDRSPSAALRLEPQAVDESESFLAAYPATRGRFERVAKLVDGFETPYGMELLSSAHWVASRDPQARASASAAVELIHAWSVRKREKLKSRHVTVAWERLRDQGWFEESPRA